MEIQTHTQYLREQYGQSPAQAFAKRLLILVLFFGVVYIARPLFHGLFYSMLFDLTSLVFGSIILTTFFTLIFTPPIYRVTDRNSTEEIKLGLHGVDETLSIVTRSESIVYKLFILIAISIGSFFLIGGIGILYIHPVGWVVAALLFLALVVTTGGAFVSNNVPAGTGILLFGLLVIFLLGTWLFWAGQVEDRAIAQTAMERAETTDSLPPVNPDNPRIVPRMVDMQQASGTVSYQQHQLGASDIARAPDGSLAWSYPIKPDGTRNVVFEDQRGIFLSDMTAAENRTRTAYDTEPNQNFDPGQGLLLHRSAEWNLLKDEYLTQYNDDPVEFIYNGEAYMAYPRTGHQWDVELAFGAIPIPYTEPVWDGVAVLNSEGEITQYSPTEAQNEPILEGQRLFPFDVTNKYLNTLGYREGIINQYPIVGAHKNEIEKADMPAGAGNQQPFLVDFADRGFGYVTAFEPFGSNTRGLAELWLVDGRTGEFERVVIEEGRDVFGPERAVGLVTSEDTRTNWNRFDVVEPVPVTVDGELFWQTKVVPDDNLAVARNVFISAEQGTAVEIEDTGEIKQFLAGDRDLDNFSNIGQPSNNEQTRTDATSPGTDDNDGPVLIIRDNNGSIINRIPLGDNTTIEITRNESTND